MKIKNTVMVSLLCTLFLYVPTSIYAPAYADVQGSTNGDGVRVDATKSESLPSNGRPGGYQQPVPTSTGNGEESKSADPAQEPAPQTPVYTDGTVRDQRGCITANYTSDGGGIMTERLVNNRGQQIALCSKAVAEPTPTMDAEEDNGPSEEALIAQQAAHEYTRMNLPTPVLKANDGKEAHPGYMNLYYGYNTHFYTEKTSASTQRKEATLLGNKIIIEAIPVGYTYIYGDKLPNNTVSYPSGPVSFSERLDDVPLSDSSHVYTVTGNFHAYVQVTYQGRYQTPDGVWHVIDGSVSKRSEALLMRIWRDDSHPVAKTCVEDPYARGCPSGPGGRSDPDNPNPRLLVPDVFTAQRWHKDDLGVGDTEVQRWYGYREIPVRNEVWERRHYSQR